MNPLGWVRSNWRVFVLVLLVLAAAYFLFVPGAPISGPAADASTNGSDTAGATNLQYGIQLGGGARISAPVEGTVAADVGVTTENNDQVREAVLAATNASESAVVTSVDVSNDDFPRGTVEVRAPVDREAFLQGLRDAGLDVSSSDLRSGVTDYTRNEVVETLNQRLGVSGFSGGTATEVRGGDERRVRVEAPGEDLERLETLVTRPGQVELVAHVPADNERGYNRTPVLFGEDILDPGTVTRDEAERPYVPVTVSESGADEMTDFMQNSGFADRGAERCSNELDPGPGEWCLLTKVDNETVYSSGVDGDLADDFANGQFRQDRSFRVFATSFGEAQELRINLRSGVLPSRLDVDRGTQLLVNPALAEGFRTNSFLTGVIAVLAVVVMVFLRYGDPRVALPMSATALSEVLILLGFAAAIGWPLELSHVAGFIAVIGTGVDDLIIIADEVKAEGQVSSQRVFQSRFRKAFWVIGAAAATTIVAMSPLAILDLGDLRGFAIITILGVLIGVVVSRPAYGSILRSLTTRDR